MNLLGRYLPMLTWGDVSARQTLPAGRRALSGHPSEGRS